MKELQDLLNKHCTGERHVDVNTAAKHLGLSIWSIYRGIKLGQIPAYKVGGKISLKLSEVEASSKMKVI